MTAASSEKNRGGRNLDASTLHIKITKLMSNEGKITLQAHRGKSFAILTFEYLNGLTPSYLREKFELTSFVHQNNTRLCKDLDIDKQHLNFLIIKLSIIIIHTSYYIFCMRNKKWTDPELLSF